MKKEVNTMVESIKSRIILDMRDVFGVMGFKTFKMVLAAYNTYQESERDGVDYIFNLNDKYDLKCCVEGGLTAQEICGLWLKSQSTHSEYFLFGCNYSEPQQFATIGEVRDNLIYWLDDMLPYVLAYPHLYGKVYEKYVTDYILDNTMSDLDALAQLRARLEEESNK